MLWFKTKIEKLQQKVSLRNDRGILSNPGSWVSFFLILIGIIAAAVYLYNFALRLSGGGEGINLIFGPIVQRLE